MIAAGPDGADAVTMTCTNMRGVAAAARQIEGIVDTDHKRVVQRALEET